MDKITFVYPIKTKPVSITGGSCSLSCAHCNGHYLKHMDSLWNINNSATEGHTSYLVSGGCDQNGSVPLGAHIDLLKRLSRDHRLIAHTGLLNEKDIEKILPYISAASFNFIGDDRTIKDVMGLDKTKEDFINCYRNLQKSVETVPHVTVGLNRGNIVGEYDSVDLLSTEPPKILVFNVLIPTANTDYHKIEPPQISDVMDVISYAKESLPNTSLYLGCMRPGGLYRNELDDRCLDLGVQRIVMPGKGTKEKAKGRDLLLDEKWECCIL